MRWVYDYLFLVMWAAFLVYWQVMAVRVKATQRLEPIASRVTRVILFGAALILLWSHSIPLPWLYWHLMPVGFWPFWVGAAITAAGLMFAVWARVSLGRNWSRSVTIKEGHELIVSGPYALARHPIYTGILTGFLGSAIALTEVRGVVALLLIAISFWAKLRLEERWMREQFGTQYEMYSERVAALVPFVL
jgi:protein-S-isoprenylcysteine O-methyltransferase Ste14